MKKFSFLALLFAGSLVLPSLLGNSEFSGLWKIVQDTQTGPVVFHLLVSRSNQPTLYDSFWRTLALVDYKSTPKSLHLNWIVKGINIAFEGRREGFTVSGTWKLIHPQYQLERPFEARRIFPIPDWRPLEGPNRLETPDRFLDFSAYLLEKAPPGKEKFDDFWKREVEPLFYVFLVDESPDSDLAYQRISRTVFERKVLEFRQVTREVRTDLARVAPRLTLTHRVVSVPFGKKVSRPMIVGENKYLLINVNQVGEERKGKQYHYFLAEEMIGAELDANLPQPRSGALQLYRLGVSLFLAGKLNYSTSRADFFFMPEDEIKKIESDLESYKKTLRSGKETVPIGVQKVVGFHFVRMLSQRFAPEEMTKMGVQQISSEFRAYIASRRL